MTRSVMLPLRCKRKRGSFFLWLLFHERAGPGRSQGGQQVPVDAVVSGDTPGQDHLLSVLGAVAATTIR